MAAESVTEVDDDPWAHLSRQNRVRLTRALRERINEVFRANRVIEQRTGYKSHIAKQMMVDVLAHLATLAEGVDLDEVDQASQLAKIEEHLHRAIIEHPEEVIRNRIVDVEERWAVYEREAFPLRDERNLLAGVPLHRELEEDRKRIDTLMESARQVKPRETPWDLTLNAAAEMTEAAHLTRDLANKLEQCIGKAADVRRQLAREDEERRRELDRQAEAARTRRRSTLQWTVGIIVSIALSTGTYLLGKSQRQSQAPAGPVPTQSASPTPGQP